MSSSTIYLGLDAHKESITIAVPPAVAFGGWWEIHKRAGETKDPARTLRRALALGVLTVTVVYVLTSAVFLHLVPLERVTAGETLAAVYMLMFRRRRA